MVRDDDHRHAFVDERDRPMLELARGIAFGVDIGDFLELERALQRELEHIPLDLNREGFS